MLVTDLPISPANTLSRPGTSSTASSAAPQETLAGPPAARGPRKDRPCDACRRRKTRCVTQEQSLACSFCKLHSKECTYLEKPAPRKRKAKDDSPDDRSKQARRIQTVHSRPIKPERLGYVGDHALLTPVSDVNLDWWPKGDASGQPDFDQLADLADGLIPDATATDHPASDLAMAWRVPQSQRGDAKTDAVAGYLWDTWSNLLRLQAADSPCELSGSILRSVYDMSTAMQEKIISSQADVESPSDAKVFQQMASLTQVLAMMLDVFPSRTEPQAMQETLQDPTREALARAKPIQIALKEWFAALPSELRMDHNDASEEATSAKPSLNLSYYAMEVHLHTHIVSSISPITTQAELTTICRHAAKSRLLSAMDFLNRLRPAQLQATSWHHTAAANFAAIGAFADLLRRSAHDADEGQWYEQRLREYRWTLGVSVRNADWLSPVVTLVDQMLEQPSF